MDSQIVTLCTAGCGFYGNSQFNGMCSKCYKSKYMGDASAMRPTSSSASRTLSSEATHGSSLPSLSQASSTSATMTTESVASEVFPSPTEVRRPVSFEPPVTPTKAPLVSTQEPEKPSTPSSATKAKNRCALCRQKVGLLGFTCKCEQLLCAQHRHADQHGCTYDYKSAERARLEKANPTVVADKVHNRI